MRNQPIIDKQHVSIRIVNVLTSFQKALHALFLIATGFLIHRWKYGSQIHDRRTGRLQSQACDVFALVRCEFQ